MIKANRADAQTERIVYLDYLRVLATFGVMLIHLASQNWNDADVNSLTWHLFNGYDSVVRWAVPVFVMISGAIFLSRGPSVKTIFTKYIPRLVTAYVFWSVLYALTAQLEATEILPRMITGYYHMWFIPMIISLYISIPILKQITASDSLTKYYLAAAFAAGFFCPALVLLCRDFGGDFLVKLSYAFEELFNNMHFDLVLGYTGYFVAGFYLHNRELSKKARGVVYLCGLAGFAATLLLSAYLTIKLQVPVDHYYGHFTINVLLESLAVFVWFRYHPPKMGKFNTLMAKLSKYSFGAYLVHFLVMDQLEKQLGLTPLSFHPLVSVPALGLLIFALSYAISWGLNSVPFLKKYIV